MNLKSSRDGIEKFHEIFDSLYEHLNQIRSEGITFLGGKDAFHIIDFHGNNWIDIWKWITLEYKEESKNRVLFFFFSILYKEIYWLQYIFLNANYPIVYRNLRYIWEMFALGYYVEDNYSYLTLDEGMEKCLEVEEKGMFGWNMILTSFSKILKMPKSKIIKKFHPLWKFLNKNAHPSIIIFNEIMEEDFSALITDSFNEDLSRSTLFRSDIIFDLVYASMFKRFPKITKHALNFPFLEEWKNFMPITYNLVKNSKIKSHVTPAQ